MFGASCPVLNADLMVQGPWLKADGLGGGQAEPLPCHEPGAEREGPKGPWTPSSNHQSKLLSANIGFWSWRFGGRDTFYFRFFIMNLEWLQSSVRFIWIDPWEAMQRKEMQNNVKRHKGKQAVRDNAKQSNAQLCTAMRSTAMRSKALQRKALQCKAMTIKEKRSHESQAKQRYEEQWKQCKARRSKVMQSKAMRSTAMQSNAKQRAKQSKVKQSRTGSKQK